VAADSRSTVRAKGFKLPPEDEELVASAWRKEKTSIRVRE
jgi:hypothetical protein